MNQRGQFKTIDLHILPYLETRKREEIIRQSPIATCSFAFRNVALLKWPRRKAKNGERRKVERGYFYIADSHAAWKQGVTRVGRMLTRATCTRALRGYL